MDITLFFLLEGLPVNIIPSGFAEDLDKTNYEAPTDYVKENSRLKALYVAEQNKVNFQIFLKNTIIILMFYFKSGKGLVFDYRCRHCRRKG